MIVVNEPISDVWTRLPTRPGERLQGLSRAHIYNLIADGAVKSACLRKPGATTGVRVIHVPSLLKYIEQHVEA
jgi:hypothetical protein